MIAPPSYFEIIQKKAAQRWEQLEADPELAGPWHQLFKQVQSPRHILSELLQNADDAGATEASVRIESDFAEGNVFIFEHNGEDFTEEHFASLCRFGYSNKRALHTIGFRGIGFKSTFSLGDTVNLETPTLSVAFHRDRFTEPQWKPNGTTSANTTTIKVPIADDYRRLEVEKNLQEWLKSPVSLLFFKNIRRITIGNEDMHWGDLGPGPIQNSTWQALFDDEENSRLLVRSAPEAFPEDALREIRQERMLGDEGQDDFPPCTVEIVLGVEGRLFVVLPTGVRTELPFACNAPFVQDPARLKIKDPETSPTNRWLLGRIGALAASAMIEWLQNTSLSTRERADAYDCLPDVPFDESELEAVCGQMVEQAFVARIGDADILLAEENILVGTPQCIAVPAEIFDVWPGQQAATVLDSENRKAFSSTVSEAAKTRLNNHKYLNVISRGEVLDTLRSSHLPRPKTWQQLLELWCFVDGAISRTYFRRWTDLKVVPVQGQDVLYAANEVVRLGEKKLLQSEEDWQFLGQRMSVLNQNWLRYLTEQRRLGETSEDNDKPLRADHLLKTIGLDEPSDAARVVGQVASEFFSEGEVYVKDAIRIAQIAAKLGAQVSDHFCFTTQDGKLRPITSDLIFDPQNQVELIVPNEFAEEHILLADYGTKFFACSREEWLQWISSGRSGLNSFVPIKEKMSVSFTWTGINREFECRRYDGRFNPRYATPYFRISDWMFEESVWDFWEEQAAIDESLWGKIVENILVRPKAEWADKIYAGVREYASNGNSKTVVTDNLLSEWVTLLADKPCLKDAHGVFRKPADLLRRTWQTEAVLDIEAFVHPLLDNENTRDLLVALGVSDTPTGPKKLLGRLRALSKAENAPAHEVEKWYRRLDQMISAGSSEIFADIRAAFAEDRLILTESGSWETTDGVYLLPNETDVPGAEVIRASVRELTLWLKIGVSERPSADQAIAWLNTLRSGQAVPPEHSRRVRGFLARFANRVWEECGYWLNLSGEWSPTDNLEYAVTMRSLTGTRHLHEWVKSKTANFQDLPNDTLDAYPFSELPALAEHIEERFHRDPSLTRQSETKEWITQLGKEFARVKEDDELLGEHLRSQAIRLAATKWQVAPNLEIIPYIDGTPAGTPRRTDAVWLEDILFVEDRSTAKLAKPVAQEIGRGFSKRLDMIDAIKTCFERPTEFIIAYMEENFDLGPYADDLPKEESLGSFSDEEARETESPETEMHPRAAEDIVGAIDDNQESLDAGTDELDEDGMPQSGTEINSDPEQDTEVSLGLEAEGQPAPKNKHAAKTPLIERYALSLGYKPDGENRFYSADGSWIGKGDGTTFQWARFSPSGDVIQQLRVRDHCLQKSPLEIEANIWEILQNRPDEYSLILADLDDKPIALSGKELTTLRDDQRITLYPATYRLVYENE